MFANQTPPEPTSKVWSCATLDDGVRHVASASLPDDEAQLLAMLKEPIVKTLFMSNW